MKKVLKLKRGVKLNVAAASDVGLVRDANEDRFCVISSPETIDGLDALFVVADGMGGHAAGEVASSMAVEHICHDFTRRSDTRRTQPNDLLEHLKLSVQAANSRIYEEAVCDRRLGGMGTTLTALGLSGEELLIAHVGDSRAYLMEGNAITQLTQDHSWVGEQVALGMLSAKEAREHPDRNVITRALGLSGEVKIDAGRRPLPKRCTLLLCSDGLYDSVLDEDMVGTVLSARSLEAGCRKLIKLANDRGGHDNITLVLARIAR
jgi:protein phosphatase